MIFSFQYEEEVRVDKHGAVLLPDVCTYISKKIGYEVMGQGKHDKSIKAVRNKETEYLAAAK